MSDINLPAPNPRTAVEVVATFGDTVVGVKHVSDPRGGRTSTMTRALLVGGALSLAGAFGGFAYAAKIAATDATRKEAMIEAGRPEWAFRPHMMPQSADVAFALAGSLGLMALVWGLSRRRDERRDPRVRIGTAGGVDFAAPASPALDFAMIAPQGDGFVLRLAGGLVADGITAAEVPVTQGLRTRVRCGAMTFHVAGVPAPVRQPTPLFAAIDRRVASYFAGSLAAHAALLLVLRALPPEAENANADAIASEQLDMRYISVANEASKKDPATGTDQEQGALSNTEGTAVAMQLPGTQGAPDTHAEHPARQKTAGELNRDQAIEQARRAGVLTPWSGDQMAEVTGSDDLSHGLDDLDINGSMDGDPDGDGSPNGSFGKGRRGVGPGGELIVAGDFNTIPGGRPGGSDFNIGPSNGHCAVGHVCRGHDPVPPPIKLGHPEGDPDVSAVVQRYIKRYRDRIGYCYEKELLGNPSLEGTVNASFLIAANGAVLNASAEGVDPQVDSCIASVIQSIEFPRLSDSGTFQIKYPFILHAPQAQ